MPILRDPLLPGRLHFLKFLQPSQTWPLVGDQVFNPCAYGDILNSGPNSSMSMYTRYWKHGGGWERFQLDVHLISSMHLQYIHSIQFLSCFLYQCCVPNTGNILINKTSLRQFQTHATFGPSSVAPCIIMSNFDIVLTTPWTPRNQDNTLLSSTFSFTCLNPGRSLENVFNDSLFE